MGPAAPRTRGFAGVAEVQYSDGVGPAVLGTQVLLANAPTSPPPPPSKVTLCPALCPSGGGGGWCQHVWRLGVTHTRFSTRSTMLPVPFRNALWQEMREPCHVLGTC